MRGMEYRQLGRSGLKVPVLSYGTGTFGGGTEFFKAWGASDVAEATRLVDICLEAGVNLFDTADIYSDGLSETILGKAIAGRREKVLISTKGTFRMGPGPNDLGSSRHHLIQACEGSLRRLGTDYIDIYHLHGFDALTPQEEVLSTLDQFVRTVDTALDVPAGRVGRFGEGVFVGTPAYAAPEQIGASESTSSSTDVYALGSILFELLTGRQPFVEGALGQRLRVARLDVEDHQVRAQRLQKAFAILLEMVAIDDDRRRRLSFPVVLLFRIVIRIRIVNRERQPLAIW